MKRYTVECRVCHARYVYTTSHILSLRCMRCGSRLYWTERQDEEQEQQLFKAAPAPGTADALALAKRNAEERAQRYAVARALRHGGEKRHKIRSRKRK